MQDGMPTKQGIAGHLSTPNILGKSKGLLKEYKEKAE